MATASTAPAGSQIDASLVDIKSLEPSPLNPRKRFDRDKLQELADNIIKNGVLIPLLIRRKKGVGEIVDGERRYRAALIARAEQVPAIFRDDLTDGEVIEIMLLNQIQRQDLTPLEEAQGFAALIASNKSKYSAAYIGDRIGRTEKFVVDRMRLTELIPIAKQLLEAERILVGHAELLCRLKPEDQERALDWTQSWRAGRQGLWQDEVNRLDFEEDRDDEKKPSPKNLYRGLKPVTVKELASWIAHEVRFDVEHAAATAPLDFGPLQAAVTAAEEGEGRGKKVVAITHDHRISDSAKDPNERTYGVDSWVRADGEGKSKTCEYSVLGVVVAGRGQGTSLQVCVNRDKCTVHFGKAIKARETNKKLRESGQSSKAAKAHAKAVEREEQDRLKREAERKAWEALQPKIEEAIKAHIAKQPIGAVVKALAAVYENGKGIKNAEQFVRAFAVNRALNRNHYRPYFEQDTKRFGFDLNKWVKANASKPEASTSEPKKAKKR